MHCKGIDSFIVGLDTNLRVIHLCNVYTMSWNLDEPMDFSIPPFYDKEQFYKDIITKLLGSVSAADRQLLTTLVENVGFENCIDILCRMNPKVRQGVDSLLARL
jgi:hypothetical protein